jgi:hypothetical protein
LGRRERLLVVHFRSPAGADALDAVREVVEPHAGELLYASGEVASLGILDAPRPTDPNPLELPQTAAFAAAELPATAVAALEACTQEIAIHAYRREPLRDMLPARLRRAAA